MASAQSGRLERHDRGFGRESPFAAIVARMMAFAPEHPERMGVTE
jgi:hypothetical protein